MVMHTQATLLNFFTFKILKLMFLDYWDLIS